MNPASATSLRSPCATRLGEPLSILPQVVSLSNGRYNVRLSEVGSGQSQCQRVAITRRLPDETRDADGFYIYLRDLDDEFVWSAGYQPTRQSGAQYDFQYERGVAQILRVDRDIACNLSVCVSEHGDFEVRRCQLSNLGDHTRRIELTSYLEWVLGSGEGDANHPAFSKLFVETQYCAERRAILARRRPRGSDEREYWGFHSVVLDGNDGPREGIEFETNRMRFIGRGRTLAKPAALEPGAQLSGDSGPVLDPIASLRLTVSIEPGESRQVAFVLGGAESRGEIDDLLGAIGEFAYVEKLFDDVSSTAEPAGNGWSSHEDGLTAASRRVIVHPPHTTSGVATSNGKTERIFLPATAEGAPEVRSTANHDALQFENSYGGFSADGREYIIRLMPDGHGTHERPPLPWVNVIANEQAGFLVTESGAGYSWSGNSRENRTTAWHNDPVCDPHSEAIWIRDEDAGIFWSPTPGPTPAAAEYRVRHGFGYTTFEHESHELSQELTFFMARDEAVKLVRLRLVNRSSRTRRLSLFYYVHWALGTKPGTSPTAVTTEFDARQRAILACHAPRDCYGESVAFSAVRTADDGTASQTTYSCDRATFLGRYGDTNAPAAVAAGEVLDERSGSGLDPCAAWQTEIEVPPGGSFECTYLLGEVSDRTIAAKFLDKYSDPAAVEGALTDAKSFWRDTLSAIQIETPDHEIDLMVNGWLVYQNMSCRMWGRSAYYQPGGAYGFRDQLQDSAALMFHRPDVTRTQLLRNAAAQFVEGDVLHWWHPDLNCGLRTRFSDDLLWLPFVAAEYIRRTGDAAILDEVVPFISAPVLEDGQQESFIRPAPSDQKATFYEHCCRALDRGLTTGAHGLPLIGCGDWNDGFSRIGRQGKGESVWLGFFIDYVLERMLPICTERGDDERVKRFTEYRQRLREALNTTGWDGAWYRRAYYDNGQVIGSTTSDECQIDALAQAWAVISGVAPADRAKSAVEAVESRLIDNEAGIIRLLTPAFDRTPNDPGYIKGYVPGIRENGGQYTHGVLWMIQAMAELGRGTRAVELLRMLTPVWHASTKDRTDVYKTEPYVVAADIYGEQPHVGRGGWTWYTGSAGWMFRVAVESIFGLSTEGGRTLVINPSISREWPQAKLRYRLPDGKTTYVVTIENPGRQETGVETANLDGKSLPVENGVARVPLASDGAEHSVTLRLGGGT